MPTHKYRVTYRVGEKGPESYEVTRTVHSDTADVDAFRTSVARKWAGQPIYRIEVVEPVETV